MSRLARPEAEYNTTVLLGEGRIDAHGDCPPHRFYAIPMTGECFWNRVDAALEKKGFIRTDERTWPTEQSRWILKKSSGSSVRTYMKCMGTIQEEKIL